MCVPCPPPGGRGWVCRRPLYVYRPAQVRTGVILARRGGRDRYALIAGIPNDRDMIGISGRGVGPATPAGAPVRPRS
ncbi:hypothetical protein FAGKG844_460032 [Frankia sp. AgKG'84/4]